MKTPRRKHLRPIDPNVRAFLLERAKAVGAKAVAAQLDVDPRTFAFGVIGDDLQRHTAEHIERMTVELGYVPAGTVAA